MIFLQETSRAQYVGWGKKPTEGPWFGGFRWLAVVVLIVIVLKKITNAKTFLVCCFLLVFLVLDARYSPAIFDILSFIFPHPPEDKKKKSKRDTPFFSDFFARNFWSSVRGMV